MGKNTGWGNAIVRFVGQKTMDRIALRRLLSATAGALSVLMVVGCTTNTEFLDGKQSMAMETALARGRFETNCPQATGTVISREVVEPAVEGPYMMGVSRAEYTIGVAGCGQRNTFVVICPDGGDGCFAAGPGAFVR